MVESIDDTGRKYSAITQTVGEIRMDVNDVSGKYANLSLKVDAISAVVGDGSTGSFSEFLQTVNEISASVTEVKNGLDTHKGSFHVTADKINAMVSATDSISNTIRTTGWITTADGNKLWATLNQYNELHDLVSSHTGSFHVTASKIEAMVSATDSINNTIKTAGWITTADGNKLWATISTVDSLGNKLISHEGKFHVTASKIEAMVTATDNISNTIKTAGWITKSDGNTWWASKGTEQTAADAAKSAINAATAAADAMTRANSAYDKADDTATALVQTNSSLSAIAGRFNADGTLKEGAGWVTTADANTSWVKKDGIISAINQTAESVTVDASKINLNGAITANGYFKINLDGSVEASAGTIAGLKISGESLTNEGFDNDACIILRNDSHKTFAAIGGNTLPASSGIRAVARFENEESNGYWGNTNVAMIVRASGATHNRAVVATGDILTDGLNIGYGFREYSFTANNQWLKPSVLKSDILYVYFNYSNCAFVLPTLRDVCESLGISYSTPFAIRLTVISSSGDGKLYGRNKTIAGTSGYEYPELMSWTGGIDTSGYNINSHDSFEVCLFYNGGSGYIPSNEGAYRAYITGVLR